VRPSDDEEQDHRDRPDPDRTVTLRSLDRGLAGVERSETDPDPPGGAADHVPHHETPPVHPTDARYPADGRAEDRNEPGEENRLASMFVEELLGPIDHLPGAATEHGLEDLTAPPPPEHVARGRAGDGGTDRRRNDRGEAEMSLLRENSPRDQRRLAGDEREAGDLEENDREDETDAELLDEMSHATSVGRASSRLAPVRIGVPRELEPAERRVALVPDVVSRLGAAGFDVVVERGAGVEASFPDSSYEQAGADVADDPYDVEAVVKVRKPTSDEVERLRDGQVLIGFLEPLTDPSGIERLSARGVTAFAMESIPRITRAQTMDALSSQSTVAGYKAVLLGAERLPKFFPMLMTAAGTVPPAKVLVLGAGVAGLQAIATARRLGAVVTGFDVRPVVKEQVESLGATFLELNVRGEETEGGYARELSEDEQRRQQQELAERVPEFDVVITTALVPGRPAPKLIPTSAVAAMRPGSVIVDLAAETGGNCELTEPGEVVERDGVTIVGLTNLPSTMPFHASQLYARNVSALLQHLAPEGELSLDWEDEITAGACVTRAKAPA